MRVSTRVHYGCRALVRLAVEEGGDPVPIEVIAEKENLSERYLAKIVQDLRRGGIVRSVRGAAGGYVLARPAGDITLLHVWEALEGPFVPLDCVEDHDLCPHTSRCATRGVWMDIKRSFDASLAATTLAWLAEARRLEDAELAAHDPVRAAAAGRP